MKRTAIVYRKTQETDISLDINLDGIGSYSIETPVGFLNHMLEQLSKHSLIDLSIRASGDSEVDNHHVIEDTAIALGEALLKAVGEKKGINRYGYFLLPMDEVLIACSIDLSGRMSFETNYRPKREMVNDLPTEMIRHFFKSLTEAAKMNLHFQFLNAGENEHHRIEAMFKALGRSLRMAVEQDPRIQSVPSTKGTL